jgi:hypothetical protein
MNRMKSACRCEHGTHSCLLTSRVVPQSQSEKIGRPENGSATYAPHSLLQVSLFLAMRATDGLADQPTRLLSRCGGARSTQARRSTIAALTSSFGLLQTHVVDALLFAYPCPSLSVASLSPALRLHVCSDGSSSVLHEGLGPPHPSIFPGLPPLTSHRR